MFIKTKRRLSVEKLYLGLNGTKLVAEVEAELVAEVGAELVVTELVLPVVAELLLLELGTGLLLLVLPVVA